MVPGLFENTVLSERVKIFIFLIANMPIRVRHTKKSRVAHKTKAKRTHHVKVHRRRRHHMRGGNFWDDFKSGFNDGFGFVMNIANQVAPLIKMAAV